MSAPFKLIAIDLDGTLLDDDGHIPTANKDAIAMLLTRNIKVVIATGRGIRSATTFIKELQLQEDMPLVMRNGAFVKSSLHGDLWQQSKFNNNESHQIIAALLAENLHPVIGVDQGTEEDFYLMDSTMRDPIEADFYKVFHPCIKEVPNLLTVNYPPVSVIGARGSETGLQQVKHILDQRSELNLSSHILQLPNSVSDVFYLECHREGTNKWNGINQILKRFNIASAEVIAIGDAVNDIHMLTHAGLGIAMHNAHSQCKAIANEIAPSNNNCGVATMIEKYLL